MANEITVLEGRFDRTYKLVFLYPITTPVQLSGQNVVPTPSADLPETAKVILSQAEMDNLDNGLLAFEVTTFRAQPGLAGAALLARVREIYSSRKSLFDIFYDRKYAYIGTRVDAAA